MMRGSVVAVITGLALMAGAAAAQQGEAPRAYIYSTYYECPAGEQWMADGMVEMAMAPHWNAAVDDGTVTAWGWLAHHTGGEWRRAFYYVAPTLEALLDAGSVNDKIDEDNPLLGNKFSQVCPSHVDYIWRQVAGSPAAIDRGEVGFSVYFVCDSSRERRADELVGQVIGPLYDRQVASGALKSWGWNEHVVGGEYRRLATATAADVKTLMKARQAILEEVQTKHAEAAGEFDSICGSHEDYIWNIRMEKP